MSLASTTSVKCPKCGTEVEAEVILSINAERDARQKQLLMAGALNRMACVCGYSARLASKLLYSDLALSFFCQVVPGGDTALMEARQAFSAIESGTKRIVPDLNALVEKVKLLEAWLNDWVIELCKLELLGSIGERDLNRIVLFEGVDLERQHINWVIFDRESMTPERLTSSLEPYTRGVDAWAAPAANAFEIDRRWAQETARKVAALPN